MRSKQRAGRPKNVKPKVDLGTVQLRKKRAEGLTMEALDLALARGVIEQNAHEAGLRLRWLYTLRFGAPNVSAYDPDGRFGGAGVSNQHSPEWNRLRTQEYQQALDNLDKVKAKRLVMWVCVFDKRPLFLRYRMRELAEHHTLYEDALNEQECFKQGMEVLADFFQNGKKHPLLEK